jgi:hypothetical protein
MPGLGAPNVPPTFHALLPETAWVVKSAASFAILYNRHSVLP